MNLYQLALLAAVMGLALSAIMAAAWQVQRTTGHTGWIDVCWTFGTGTVAALGSLRHLRPIARLPRGRSWSRC